MREAHGQQVCVDIDTPEDILEALLFFMYGKLEDVAEDAMLPLFKLADSHEVRLSLYCLVGCSCTWQMAEAGQWYMQQLESYSTAHCLHIVSASLLWSVSNFDVVLTQVLVLRSMCLEAIVQSLSIDNVVEYLMFADSCSEPRLLEACKDYATSHRYVGA